MGHASPHLAAASGHRCRRNTSSAVGPSWWPGKEPEADTLARVYRRSFALVANHGIRTVALSAIGCGFYAYPLAEASAIAVRETVGALKDGLDVEQVRFLRYLPTTFTAPFASALAQTRNESRGAMP
jgi:O-acetyl-ADP-ribose deacetylase (regulator of RNase III)